MVQDITRRGLAASDAASKQGVSAVTARKWVGRYLAGGAAGLMDKSSRADRSPRAIEPSVALTIVELRRKLFLQSRIAWYTGVSKATVSLGERGASLISSAGVRVKAGDPVPQSSMWQALDVEFQEVAHRRDASHGRKSIECAVWPMPVVSMQEGLRFPPW